MKHLTALTAALLVAASLDRAARSHLVGCALFTVGASALICGGVSVVSLVGGLVAAAGSLTMARTAHAAGAE